MWGSFETRYVGETAMKANKWYEMKERIYNYRYLLMQAYWLIYLPWFMYLENNVTSRFHVIHMELDDAIPFISAFCIPYFLWFGYVALALTNSYIHDKQEYVRACIYLFTGMTIFLIISTVYPNGHYMRYQVNLGSGIFDKAVRWLWSTDTATNLFPSIHVFNSIGAHIALTRSENLRDNRRVKYISFIVMCSIILATVFIKQHSVFDVITALLMALVLYPLVYGRTPEKLPSSTGIHSTESESAF
jgi:membrane-associated phospholipid phosphatase